MLYKAGLQRLFLAQQPTLLSKSSHIPLLPVCLSPRRTKMRLGMSCCRWTSLWPDHTLMHTHRIHTDPSRENKSMLGDLFQQLSEWLTVSPSVLHIQQMALSVSICTVAQKDNSSVCAWGDYSIPLLFLLHSHTNPGLLTLQSSEITQTCKKHKVATHREHGKVSDHFQEWREEFKQLDRKTQWDIKKTPQKKV